MGDTGTRKRSPNFTSLEKQVMVEAIVSNYDTLFGNLSTTVTPELRETAWLTVMSKINNLGAVPGGRTLIEIKKKYQQLKTEVKARESSNKREILETGGGSAAIRPQSEIGEKILSTIPLVSICGISGGYDSSDQTSTFNGISDCPVPLPSANPTSANERPKPGIQNRVAPPKIAKKKKAPETSLYYLQFRQVSLLEKQCDGIQRIGDLLEKRNEIESEKLIVKRRKLELLEVAPIVHVESFE